MAEKRVKKRKGLKNVRKAKKRHTRNVRDKNILKAAVKAARAALASKAADLVATLQKTFSILDKAAERGLIHQNKAARLKSRLALASNKVAR